LAKAGKGTESDTMGEPKTGETPRVTVPQIRARRGGVPIAMLTAYDHPTSQILDQAGVDIILIGDSLGNVVLGYHDTIPVTMEEMLHHCRAVSRGAERALLIGDMPFMSYQAGVEQAVINAGRFLKEGGVDAVKLEGGAPVVEAVRRMSEIGIPVMGHLGLTPQSIHAFGRHQVTGKSEQDAARLVDDARALEDAGAFSIVLELVQKVTAKRITEAVSIPTIGIGSGPHCDGQVLVFHDMVGIYEYIPKHVKLYANLRAQIMDAVQAYVKDVTERRYP
jgi:3-methyl-2-oxobutanoate hydroxymethyltransferase